jgi:uncharacterized protein (DUF1499 family)
MRLTLSIVGGLLVLWFAAQVLFSRRRPELGVSDGLLQPCGPRPNCVCSQATAAAHAISPLSFEGDAQVALQNLKQIVDLQPGTKLIAGTDHYLRFECTTPLMRYIDDLEFVLDASRSVIHVRSASRVGYSDLGTNRQRVDHIRKQLALTQSGELRGGDVR